ncbi:sushi, von Willebrand factor type A, EGF and pentraxin domain-containing protein 1-like [Uranotaenia lowii]|uniref:sushi, von Willebrand factor type A, EGF and pentraxin domain-containing protein 1-like n=1 Tax=Uranotaenia lowii TaxID=190385 RepID=UPI00247A9772|nr:sushi, von Willebrand factor type A, EGF and pentraxin domain-containing protein 1-like [Uranotaenia lowii]
MIQAPLRLVLLAPLVLIVLGTADKGIVDVEKETLAPSTSQSSTGADDYQEYDDADNAPDSVKEADDDDARKQVSNTPPAAAPVVELGQTADSMSPEVLGVSNEILKNENSVIKIKVDRLSGSFKANVEKIKTKHKRVDIVFLIDASSSVGKTNFGSEIKFVKKLLSDFNVSYNYTRVAVVTFSSQNKIIRHIDQISQSVEDNDKCMLLNYQVPKIKFTGGGTYTYGALKEAEEIFRSARIESKKIVFLITDGFSNGKSPVPLAAELRRNGITIYSIGIQSGNYAELYNISSEPGESHSFLLDSFDHFETLARKALHSDYKSGEHIAVNASLCNVLCENEPAFFASHMIGCCDPNASCGCDSSSGHYSCICPPGYVGTGRRGGCHPCANGTYWAEQNKCDPCPDTNYITQAVPAMNVSDCVCKNGYKEAEDGHCQVITCPELSPPENGYFVKHPNACGQVLNAACGTRCQSGYQLVGDSIRLCQEDGVWSGNEPKCVLKTCPSLSIPYYGLVVCKNPDLNLYFDYSPRNKSFLTNYSISTERSTEPMPIDTECAFKCGHGFYLVGSNSRNCLPLSKWDGLQTSCKQIVCPALPKIPFGEYDPTDCADQKSAHGSNCTLVCDFGFELKGGPSTKSCGGKRNGVWTQKAKTPRCVDVTPPHLLCPNNYTLPMHDDFNYAIVRRLNQPYVFDNGGDNFTFWTKPAIKEQGTKLFGGVHLFTYVAVDSFKNKAKCNFSLKIIDSTAPVIENCNDPAIFFVTSQENVNETWIEWDEPTVFDNSDENVTLDRDMDFGFHDAGNYSVTYKAEDSSGNAVECVLNVTVKVRTCDPLPSPPNGESVCAKNSSHTWCEVTCHFDHSFHDLDESSVTLFCDNRSPKWQYETVPECTAIEKPDAVEEVFTINLGAEGDSLCDDSEAKEDVENLFSSNMRQHLCGDQQDCTITTVIPACENVEEPDETAKYNIVKRDVKSSERVGKAKNQNAKRDDRATIKINVYTKLSKKLGLWRQDGKKSDNIKRVKAELQNINTNDKLRKRLSDLNMDLSVLKLDEIIRCPNGSVAKKLVCVQCPRGTYHNMLTNSCQPCPIGTFNEITGQSDCIHCPPNHSTRKPNSKHSSECKAQCPPGTVAKLKLMKKDKTQKYHKSLMPFCRKCDPGEYQGLYNRISCDRCPHDYTSPRGSTSITDCTPKVVKPCQNDHLVCGSNGRCVPQSNSSNLYSCLCDEGFAGSHCEHQMNVCASAPCYNMGSCVPINGTSFRCECRGPYGGELCDQFIDPCQPGLCRNGGSCIEIDGRSVCECPTGYDGTWCENGLNFCHPNPCENGGVCRNDKDNYICVCPPGRMGKRCNLRPCDYLPCPKNAICIDIGHVNTSKDSFRCVCPNGLKGPNCTQIDNPCDRNPCRNNGICRPLKLRDLNNPLRQTAETDEEIYMKVSCECPPYFYGSSCETLITPDFVMSFERSSTNDYAKIAGPKNNLSEISLCTWIKTSDDFNYGSVLSYATSNIDNAFTFTDYSGFVLYVNGDHIVTNVYINDGSWHFICLTWTSSRGLYEIYLDGELHTTGFNLSNGQTIQGNGLFVIGQEQDLLGGGFSESESFVGKLAYLDLWSRALHAYEVIDFYHSCEPYQGDLIKWTDLKSKVVGNVRIQRSEFCRSCERNISLPNGFVEYRENRAYLECEKGYQLNGPSEIICLRTSRWSNSSSFCKLIRCGSLSSILNGKVMLSKSSYGGVARFVCDEGFYLSGADSARCTIHGNWSHPLPECISIVKCPALIVGPGQRLTYASEKGVLSETFESYAVGTLVEVKCDDQYYLEGENLLTCLDTAAWDEDLPQCIPVSAISSTTDMAEVTSSEKVPRIIKINRRPDVRFWKQLKDYYFYGCDSQDTRKVSVICHRPETNTTRFRDLTAFSLSTSGDYQNMDSKFLGRLQKTVQPVANLSLENLFDYIIYGKTDPDDISDKLTDAEEDSYRFVLCLYIDIIMMDREVNFDDEIVLDINSRENTNDKIKSLLKNIVQPVYEAHVRDQEEDRQRELENQRNALKKILALAEVERKQGQQCRLSMVPEPPIDSRIIAIDTDVFDTSAVDLRIERLRKRPENLAVGDRIYYGCNVGFSMKGTGYVECLSGGHWSYTDSFCGGVLCNEPPVLPGMVLTASSIDLQYYYEDEIEYRCIEGHVMQGHPIVKCLVNGKWSPVMARCTKISCGKPKVSSTAKIISGSSYQFGEKLRILCEDKRTVETVCMADGKWQPYNSC